MSLKMIQMQTVAEIWDSVVFHVPNVFIQSVRLHLLQTVPVQLFSL